MVDVDTFVILLYVMIDDFCQSQGPQVMLMCSELVS